MAGLADDDRTTVAFVRAPEKYVEGDPAVVTRFDMPVNLLAAGHLPLIVVVEIDADHVEVPEAAAELRRNAAGNHVPRFPLTVVLSRGDTADVITAEWRNGVNHRLH